ncbi:septum site-determining protein Ssd [Nocardia sp. NPDC052001]|uniref:septum site-determining protein Ssd n=1 Tax=Nocardia sp. NPDC052001 TaxID=3154853 RepID=UPI003430715B
MDSHIDDSPRALALLSDPRLREEVRRIAAAADRPLDERTAPVARHPWAAAPVIVLDTPAARCCISAGSTRRPGILLVTDGEPGLLDWQTATELGAENVLPLPTAAPILITAFTTGNQPGSADGAIVAVAGAAGGSGASTLAAAIALAAAARTRHTSHPRVGTTHPRRISASPHAPGRDELVTHAGETGSRGGTSGSRGGSSGARGNATGAQGDTFESRVGSSGARGNAPGAPGDAFGSDGGSGAMRGDAPEVRGGVSGSPARSASTRGEISGVRGDVFAGQGGSASTRSGSVRGRGDFVAGREPAHTLLVDAAPFGGGIDLLLGLEGVPGLRWPDLVIEDGRVSASALHDALPSIGGAAVLSCGRGLSTTELAPSAVRAVLDAGRGAGDLVVCDVSAERGPHAEEVLDAADLVVLVVPARLRAIAAAESAAAYLARRNPHVRLLVRGPSPGGLRGCEISETLGLPLLAALPPQPGLAERLERGGLTIKRRGPLRTAADLVLTELGHRSAVRASRIGSALAGARG